jgi:uncharacterized protein (TIGR02284 family)
MREIEKRLSPDAMTGDIGAVAKHLVEGTPHPIADAIRRNPLPAALIAVGAAWLALEVFRGDRAKDTGTHHLTLPPGSILDQASADVLADLIGVARQGTKALRQAGQCFADGHAHQVLRSVAEERGRTAAILQSELQRFGIDAVHGDAPTGDHIAAWGRALDAIHGGDQRAILNAVEAGEDATREKFRAALTKPMPESLRVLVAGRFNEVERSHARVSALVHAVARV